VVVVRRAELVGSRAAFKLQSEKSCFGPKFGTQSSPHKNLLRREDSQNSPLSCLSSAFILPF
jgi:hypothetical protein